MREFSEVLVLKREDFLHMALKVSKEAFELFIQIKTVLSKEQRNFKILLIKCYICNKIGHIAIDCE